MTHEPHSRDEPVARSPKNIEESVLILTPFFSPNVGGVETHLDDLCSYLTDQAYKVHVLTYRPLTTDAVWRKTESYGNTQVTRIWWPAGKTFHVFEGHPLLQFLYLVPRLLLATVVWQWRHPEVRLVHVHGLAAAIAARVSNLGGRRKLFFTSHAVYDMYPSMMFRRVAAWCLKGFDHCFALSSASRNELVALGLDESRVSLYRHWIDENRFAPVTAEKKVNLRSEWNVPLKDMLFLYVGRLIEKKGVGLVRQLAEKMPEVSFAVAGGGPMEHEIRESARVLENLHFLGSVPADRCHEIYQLADVLLIPSQYEEGFGRVAIEGMACGLQIIASAVGALPSILEGTAAHVVAPRLESFADAIRDHMRSDQSAEAIATSMRLEAERLYTSKNGSVFIDAYATYTNS